MYLIITFIFIRFFEHYQKELSHTIDKQNATLIVQKKQLQQSNHMLQMRTNELLKSNQELERFAYVASHDLKTPLNNIISFSGLLEEELESFDSNDAHEYFSFIKTGSQKMSSLIKDVLEYSRLSSKAVEVEIDIGKLIQEIEESIQEYLLQRNAKIIVNDVFPTIKANHTRIYLLFKNLIENAIKYNESTNRFVEIKYQKQDKFHQLIFKDNGIGIDEKHHCKVFEMFTRLHNNRKYEGTGLGLSLSKKIIETIGGKIELKSQLGEGSTFIIYFPINEINIELPLAANASFL